MADIYSIMQGINQSFQSGYDRGRRGKISRLAGDVYNAAPEQRQSKLAELIGLDPNAGLKMAEALDPRFQQGNGIPSEYQTFDRLAQDAGLNKDDRAKAARLRLNLEARPSSAAIGYQKMVGPDGREILVATDPRGVGAQIIGSGEAYGSGVGAPQMQASPQAAAPVSRQSMEADIALANELAQAGFDPERIDAFLAARGQRAEAPQAMPRAPQANPFAGPTLQEKAYAQEAGQQQAQLGALPMRGQIEAQNAAARERAISEVKPITAEAKPLPVGALNKVLEAQDALGATQVISDIIGKHAQRIKDNTLPFGPVAAMQAKARTFGNMATEQDANFNEWEADKTKIVNESLRLNKGVQTEGDAQRAVKELMGANDRATAARALRRLAELNNRAVQLQRQKMQTIYSNYGRDANGEPLGQPQQPEGGGRRSAPPALPAGFTWSND